MQKHVKLNAPLAVFRTPYDLISQGGVTMHHYLYLEHV